MTDTVAVKVALKIRPPNAISKGKEADIPIRRQSLSVIPGTDSVTIGRDADSAGGSSPLGSGSVLSASPNNLSSGRRGFTFDRVFGPDVTQQAFYHDCCSSLIQQFMDGFNVTIFAYSSPEVPPEHVGIIPRAIGQVMGAVQKQPEDTAVQFSVKCTFLEIYQEQVRDLLRPEAKDISIREDKNGVTTVVGIHEEDISSADDLLRCLEKGNLERTTGDTKMHLYSSRSHAVFTILLEQRAGDPFMNHGSENISKAPLKCSKLHLIDLAGSERLKRTGAEGVRLKESVKINSGLLALGNVISLLSGSDGQERPQSQPQHVPYRDSKLTRLLRDSLGGNAKTLMVACVSPCEEDYDETLNTLKYADRARRIQNRPIVNIVDAQRAKVLEMRERIDFLESQLVIERTNSQDRRVETPAKKAEASPDLSSDLGSDQLLGRLMEELRSRTIRGTRSSAVEVELENSRSFQMAVADELEVAKQEQTKSLQELQSAISDTMRLAEFAITVSPFVPKENAEGIEQLIRRYITNAEIKFKPKDGKPK
ncbi:P-loop containing nucleoside triphosphate hydrolase protein [Zopfochytrium polystomum]|nr:P-loop containing nucleoside triphosphate hydrolase protein [Zopfochytrium polystomum]